MDDEKSTGEADKEPTAPKKTECLFSTDSLS
jgi:hypothetical protein